MTDLLVPYTVPGESVRSICRHNRTGMLGDGPRRDARPVCVRSDWTPEAYTTDAGLRRKEEARRFLELLDPTVDGFTFQTFDDNEERKAANEKKRSELNKRRKEKGLTPLTSSSDPFAKIYNGTLDQHWDKLLAQRRRSGRLYHGERDRRQRTLESEHQAGASAIPRPRRRSDRTGDRERTQAAHRRCFVARAFSPVHAGQRR